MHRPSLLPRNATQLESAIEQVSARIDDVPVLVSTLWNADRCDERYLGWLAWALSVDIWDSDWDEAVKRAVIRQSIHIHNHKGTVGAVRRALAAIGVDIELSEWFDVAADDDAAPYTFRLDVFANEIFAGGLGINQRFLDLIKNAIDHVKPLRSHYHVRIGDRINTTFYGRAGTRSRITSKTTHDVLRRLEAV